MSQTSVTEHRAPDTTAELDVELRKVFKVFNGETAVRGIDLSIRRGEFFSILGPSGCGKTTTLRLVAGFDLPSAGEVLIQGQSMNQIPPHRRPVNTVFQSYALFNHLTVWENIAFGLRLKKLKAADVEERVKQSLKQVKMETYANRFPSNLSGGQQQRVALARALVNRPAVLLLDEPLGALDFKLRKEMQVELSNLHQDLGLTFVMVTHDQEEALSLSDRIAVMRGGKIEQIGSPTEIYDSPRTPFVADFIGDTNLFKARLEAVDTGSIQVATPTGLKIVVQSKSVQEVPGNSKDVIVIIRPEKIRLSLSPPTSAINCFEGRLKHVMYLGTHIHYVVELLSGDRLTVMLPNTTNKLPEPHTPVYARWAATDCLALEERSYV
ncbi:MULTISPECIES: ABC transporter ATP-binding protein [unclassified Coleofasciculus]|uniref:ABC transporter ATP-binding protein n=1 Tax=unclassified Coleofasciculus TaxID=2692782 RepID=UPI00187E8014|nr:MULTISPECIES: ABC transporter ATP-binding protein [unclassified Coleofasciculus]MBE9125150.1 ABC transporter ATP-binding protein [Coleofasciculus sp. LEGE 07081]MBE9148367.1 ABC transporter ATP-binding protein [Coleofasciculus sp. LEGE 07092]